MKKIDSEKIAGAILVGLFGVLGAFVFVTIFSFLL